MEQTIHSYIPINGRSQDVEGYGYQWWQKSYPYDSKMIEAIVRTGWGGQAIILFPSLDMLVVFTGGNYSGEAVIHDMVTDHILPAVME